MAKKKSAAVKVTRSSDPIIREVVKLLDQMSRILEMTQFQMRVQTFGQRQLERRLKKFEKTASRKRRA